MKTASNAMKTALAQELTYLCRLWTITLKSGAVYYFTDLAQSIVFQSQLYTADPGITISAIEQSASSTTQNGELQILFTNSTITEQDVRAGRLDGATFVLKIIDWKALDTNSSILVMQGSLSDVEWDDKGLATIQIKGLLGSSMPGNIGNEAYSKTCRAQLGDARCTKDLTGLLVANIAVDSVSGTNPGTFFSAAMVLGRADGYFALGTVLWLTGNNQGRLDDVQTTIDATGQVSLSLNPPYAVQVGDRFTIKPGCDKKLTTCKNKYNNLLNFRGEPYAPPPGKNPLSSFTQGFAIPNFQPAPQVG